MSLSNIIILFFNPTLFPSYKDMYAFNSLGFNLLLFFAISWLSTILHEAGHYLSIIREGIPISYKFNLRFVWLVVEADMTGLWSLPKKQRYLPLLAGLLVDLAVFFTVLIIPVINISHFINILCRITRLAIFYKLLWQLLLFFRTDLYYVILNASGMNGLFKNAMGLLSFIKNRTSSDWYNLSKKEKRYSFVFLLYYLAGLIASCCVLLLYIIPTSVEFFKILFNNYWISGRLLTLDGLATTTVVVFSILFWVIAVINNANEKLERR